MLIGAVKTAQVEWLEDLFLAVDSGLDSESGRIVDSKVDIHSFPVSHHVKAEPVSSFMFLGNALFPLPFTSGQQLLSPHRACYSAFATFLQY